MPICKACQRMYNFWSTDGLCAACGANPLVKVPAASEADRLPPPTQATPPDPGPPSDRPVPTWRVHVPPAAPREPLTAGGVLAIVFLLAVLGGGAALIGWLLWTDPVRTLAIGGGLALLSLGAWIRSEWDWLEYRFMHNGWPRRRVFVVLLASAALGLLPGAYTYAIGQPNPGLFLASLGVVFVMIGVVLLLNGLGIVWHDYRCGVTWKLGEYLPDRSYRVADGYSHAFRVDPCYRASESGNFFWHLFKLTAATVTLSMLFLGLPLVGVVMAFLH